MSLKVLRGSFARHFLSTRNVKRPTKVFLNRCMATVSSKHELKSPWDINMDKQPLLDYVFEDFGQWADKPALTCGTSGRSYNFGMLSMMVDRCAAGLLAALRLQPGDRIGLILPNIPEFAVLVYGAVKAGLVVTFANPLYTTGEVERQFLDSNVKAIATIEMFMPVAMEVKKSLKDYKGTIWVGGDDHDEVQGIFGLRPLLMADHEADLPTLNPDDVCVIPYSSGTTGMPKGVMLTHNNLVFNLKQVHYPDLTKYKGGRGKNETILTVPPFFHIYGLNGVLNYTLTLGFHLVSIPKFSPEEYVKCLVEYQPTALFVVPALLSFLATNPLVSEDHLKSVETIIVGAASTSKSIFEKFLQKCNKSKNEMTLLQGYGMTESSPVTLVTPYVYPHDKVGSVGTLVPKAEAKVVSVTTGETLGANQSGELFLRGPHVMKGYWNNEKATKETVDSEGWLHTGDVAYYDDDKYFYIVGRTKELIKVKGNQVSPTEIESILMDLPEVADAAVIGIPDPDAGEVPKAFVVLKPDQKLTEQQICDVVATKLAKYKWLQGGVTFVEGIPRNAGGKILRNELKLLN